MFSNFKSGENYGFYLKWLGFAEEKPHRFNEIHKYEKLKEVEDVNMLENLQKTLQNFKINRLLGQEGGG